MTCYDAKEIQMVKMFENKPILSILTRYSMSTNFVNNITTYSNLSENSLVFFLSKYGLEIKRQTDGLTCLNL